MSELITLSSGRFQAQVSTLGAELHSLKRDDDEYLWQGDPRFWGRHAPVLFPIVGTLRNDKASCSAGICHMSRHGFAREREFVRERTSPESVTLRLDADKETLRAYPYAFDLAVTYTLKAAEDKATGTLCQRFDVTNTGDVDLPFSLGGHPAFNVPFRSEGRWEDYELVFSRPWTCKSAAVTAEGLWDYSTKVHVLADADRLPLRRTLFAHDTLVLKDTPDATVVLAHNDGRPLLRVDFGGFPYLGIWSAGGKAGNAPFLAIEPWCGTATRTDEDDVFERKQGMLFASPQQYVTHSFSITIL